MLLIIYLYEIFEMHTFRSYFLELLIKKKQINDNGLIRLVILLRENISIKTS